MPVAAIEESAAACLAWLPADSLERLAHYLKPSAVRRRRDAERNALYRALGAGSTLTGRELAHHIATELGRYRSGRWRFEGCGSPPSDARRAVMHRLLTLDDQILAPERLRKVLAGIAGSKTADQMTQRSRDTVAQAKTGGASK